MEGMRTQAYSDSGGVRTIGCGHTGSGVREGSISESRAYELLRADVKRFETCVNNAIKVPITQGMFDAMVSLGYNMGCTGLSNTGITKLVNDKLYEKAAERFKSVGLTDRKGQLLRGLVTRRKIESAMFMQDGLPSARPAITKAPLITSGTGWSVPAWSWWVAGGVVAIGATMATLRHYRNTRRQ